MSLIASINSREGRFCVHSTLTGAHDVQEEAATTPDPGPGAFQTLSPGKSSNDSVQSCTITYDRLAAPPRPRILHEIEFRYLLRRAEKWSTGSQPQWSWHSAKLKVSPPSNTYYRQSPNSPQSFCSRSRNFSVFVQSHSKHDIERPSKRCSTSLLLMIEL